MEALELNVFCFFFYAIIESLRKYWSMVMIIQKLAYTPQSMHLHQRDTNKTAQTLANDTKHESIQTLRGRYSSWRLRLTHGIILSSKTTFLIPTANMVVLFMNSSVISQGGIKISIVCRPPLSFYGIIIQQTIDHSASCPAAASKSVFHE